jgi:diaminopimelate epimerase
MAGSTLRVEKLEATGNDFVIVDEAGGDEAGGDEAGGDEPALSVAVRRWLCDRHRGVGGDGVLTILRARDDIAAATGARYRMHITNPDGSVPEMCGNGLRCVARSLAESGRIPTERDVVVDTDAGPRTLRVAADFASVRIDMGRADFVSPRQFTPPLRRGTLDDVVHDPSVRGLLVTTVSMGNPHVVLEAQALPDTAEASRAGLLVEHLSVRFPERTNVEWAVDRSDGDIDVVVWERGAGLTQACGTGACAVAVAFVDSGRRAPGTITCHLPGGPLQITVLSTSLPIWMQGPVRRVFDASVVLPL